MLSKLARAYSVVNPFKIMPRIPRNFFSDVQPNPSNQKKDTPAANPQTEAVQDKPETIQRARSVAPEQETILQARSVKPEQENPKFLNTQQKIDWGWQAWRLFFWSTTALLLYNFYLNEKYEKPEEQFGSVWPFKQAAELAKKSYIDFYNFLTRPPIENMLIDLPDVPGAVFPKLIVLNLSGTVTQMDYVFGKGKNLIMRQGLQELLSYLSKKYEVIVFSDDDTMLVQNICQKLDPANQIFQGRYGRECMVYEKKGYYKDIKYLNRPNNKILFIDSNPNIHKPNAMDNVILIPEFDGKNQDQVLIDLIPFLDHLAKPELRDIRSEIKKYGSLNPQIKFNKEFEAQREELSQKKQAGIFGMVNQK